jgi:hypothetical protein
MKSISESREEFNSTMNPYNAMIIQTEHYPFSENFFFKNKLVLPNKRVAYTPPMWAGVEYMPYFIPMYEGKEKPERWREEKIATINSLEKYLICDDYSNEGETFEIAMIRLVEKGVKLEDIWCITQKGNKEMKGDIILDKGIEWHNYFIRQDGFIRKILKEYGIIVPSLIIEN